MKLQSMTDFVLNQDITLSDSRCKIMNYAHFLKQPLELWMFVPCGEDGNVLGYPGLIPSYELQEYRKAKERVLFDGCKVTRNSDNFFIIEPQIGSVYYRIKKENTEVIVEDLFKFMTDITLTETAKKQIGL